MPHPDTSGHPGRPAVTVHVVVHNGASWIRRILDPLMSQTYPNLRVLFLDNASDDGTGDIVRKEYPFIRYVRKEENLGIWAMQDELLLLDDAPFVLVLTDVILEPHFIEHAVDAMRDAPDAGSAQAKIYQANTRDDGTIERTRIIDTVGFRISRALHITNAGHGELDRGQFDTMKEVFGVEGAAPFFRRTALEKCRVGGRLIDPDYRVGGIGYGDDVDVAWRMRLFGFRHIFVPDMIGWHDRSTTKTLSPSPLIGRIMRVRSRRRIALAKRRLDWSNIRFTIIKNAFASTLLASAPRFIAREIAVAGYTLFFEPRVFLELGRFFRLMPAMVRRRKEILRRARMTPHDMNRWLN